MDSYDSELGGKLARKYGVDEKELEELICNVPFLNSTALDEKIVRKTQRTAVGDEKLYNAVTGYWDAQLLGQVSSGKIDPIIRYLCRRLVDVSSGAAVATNMGEKPLKIGEKVKELEEEMLKIRKRIDPIQRVLATTSLEAKVNDLDAKLGFLTDFKNRVGKKIQEVVEEYVNKALGPITLNVEGIKENLKLCVTRQDLNEVKKEVSKRDPQIQEAFHRIGQLKDGIDGIKTDIEKRLKTELVSDKPLGTAAASSGAEDLRIGMKDIFSRFATKEEVADLNKKVADARGAVRELIKYLEETGLGKIKSDIRGLDYRVEELQKMLEKQA